jgi:hypothetical protein
MVHSSSMLHGRMTRERAFEKQDKGALFDDEAEFLAIMIGNIFLSEEHKIDLRADHHDSIPKLLHPETFLDNYPHLNPSPRRILARFRLEQPGFYWTLRSIPADVAPFNPHTDLRGAVAEGPAIYGQYSGCSQVQVSLARPSMTAALRDQWAPQLVARSSGPPEDALARAWLARQRQRRVEHIGQGGGARAGHDLKRREFQPPDATRP